MGGDDVIAPAQRRANPDRAALPAEMRVDLAGKQILGEARVELLPAGADARRFAVEGAGESAPGAASSGDTPRASAPASPTGVAQPEVVREISSAAASQPGS